jgi:tRNA threonylcarbamoyladenosine biosynthesis protein TsaB
MLLAIDTSNQSVGIALYNGVRILSEATWLSQDYHTVELAPAVVTLLQRASVSFQNIDALAVAIGPGSFTGLRIGLALAKGLAFARRLPLIGIPTLDILAAAQPSDNIPLVAAIQAGRNRLVMGWYQNQAHRWQPLGDYRIMEARALAKMIKSPTIVCGEFTEEERRLLARKRINIRLASPAQSLRRPSYLAELAWDRFIAGNIDDTAALSPIYVHIGEPIPG